MRGAVGQHTLSITPRQELSSKCEKRGYVSVITSVMLTFTKDSEPWVLKERDWSRLRTLKMESPRRMEIETRRIKTRNSTTNDVLGRETSVTAEDYISFIS